MGDPKEKGRGEMKRVIAGILLGGTIMFTPVEAQANFLSYIPPKETTGIPVDVYENANIVGDSFNICPELLMALAERESQFTPTAENGSCKGLMQVNASYHKERFTDAGWKTSEWSDGYKNMYVAASYLADLFEEYEDVGIVLGLYHGEKNAVSKGMSGNLSSYVTGILERSEELERIHNK